MSLSTTALKPAAMLLTSTLFQHISIALLYSTTFVTSAIITLVVFVTILAQIKITRIFFKRHVKIRYRGFQSLSKLLKHIEHRHDAIQSSTATPARQVSATHGATESTSTSTSSAEANRTLFTCSERPRSHRQRASLVVPINELPVGGGYQCVVM